MWARLVYDAVPPGGGHKIAFSTRDSPSRKDLVAFDRAAGTGTGGHSNALSRLLGKARAAMLAALEHACHCTALNATMSTQYTRIFLASAAPRCVSHQR